MSREKELPVSQEAKKSTTSTSPSPPPYNKHESATSEKADFKQGNDCRNHNYSPTPLLDSYLRQSNVQQKVQAIAQALNNTVAEEQCTRCAVEDGMRALTELAADGKKAKKQCTKEERKAMKKEVKGLMKGMKGDLKKIWKESKEKE